MSAPQCWCAKCVPRHKAKASGSLTGKELGNIIAWMKRTGRM